VWSGLTHALPDFVFEAPGVLRAQYVRIMWSFYLAPVTASELEQRHAKQNRSQADINSTEYWFAILSLLGQIESDWQAEAKEKIPTVQYDSGGHQH
jgi:hypothetical protein